MGGSDMSNCKVVTNRIQRCNFCDCCGCNDWRQQLGWRPIVLGTAQAHSEWLFTLWREYPHKQIRQKKERSSSISYRWWADTWRDEGIYPTKSILESGTKPLTVLKDLMNHVLFVLSPSSVPFFVSPILQQEQGKTDCSDWKYCIYSPSECPSLHLKIEESLELIQAWFC